MARTCSLNSVKLATLAEAYGVTASKQIGNKIIFRVFIGRRGIKLKHLSKNF